MQKIGQIVLNLTNKQQLMAKEITEKKLNFCQYWKAGNYIFKWQDAFVMFVKFSN